MKQQRRNGACSKSIILKVCKVEEDVKFAVALSIINMTLWAVFMLTQVF